eukprot:6199921-Pyramimonas_sp.AAC.1
MSKVSDVRLCCLPVVLDIGKHYTGGHLEKHCLIQTRYAEAVNDMCLLRFDVKSLQLHVTCVDPDVAICVRGASDFQNYEDVPSETARTSANGT